MQIAVIGRGGVRNSMLALALSLSGFDRVTIPARGASKRTIAQILAANEIERFMAKQEDESPPPGERHRETVKRVNSGRSRAGKAARWQ